MSRFELIQSGSTLVGQHNSATKITRSREFRSQPLNDHDRLVPMRKVTYTYNEKTYKSNAFYTMGEKKFVKQN